MYRLTVYLAALAFVALSVESRHIDLTRDVNQDLDFLEKQDDALTDLDLLENRVIVDPRPVNRAPMDVLKEILNKVNEAMVKEKREYITIPPVSFNALVAKVSTGDGTVGRFSTLYLQGDDQMLKKTVVKGGVIYNFDLKLGMQDLHLSYPYGFSYLIFFGKNGVLEVKSKDDGVRAVGVVNVKDDGTCRALLSNVQVTDIGDYDIDITPTDLPNMIFKGIMSFVTNKILPYFLPTVNSYIKEAVTPPDAASDFSKLICDNVVQHVTKVF